MLFSFTKPSLDELYAIAFSYEAEALQQIMRRFEGHQQGETWFGVRIPAGAPINWRQVTPFDRRFLLTSHRRLDFNVNVIFVNEVRFALVVRNLVLRIASMG